MILRSFCCFVVSIVAMVVCGVIFCSNASARHLNEPSLTPHFSSDSNRLVHEGYFDLLWGSPSDAETEQVDNGKNWQFSVEMATNRSFSDPKVIYSGTDRGTYFSGLRDGDYFFRVRARLEQSPWSSWSERHHVQVEHHSLVLAWWLFAAGAVIFFSICIFLFRASTRTGEP